MLIASRGTHRLLRLGAFLLAIGAVGGIALLATGMPSNRWVLVAGVPIACYCLYAIGMQVYLPHREARTIQRIDLGQPRGGQREVDWLLLIRGLACALVYIMHSGIIFRRDWTQHGSAWAWVIYSPAWLGMILFFSLSGYLMGKGFYSGKYKVTRSSVGRYLRNRFLRIVPLMVVVGVLAILWQSPRLLSTPQVPARIGLFGFSSGVGGTVSIGAFWSLSTEWQFYLLVPLVFVVATRLFGLYRPTPTARLAVATILVVAAGTSIRYYQWSHHGGNAAAWAFWIYPNLFCNIDIFLLGFLVNWWLPRLRRFSSFLAVAWPGLVVAIYLPYAYISYRAVTSFDRGTTTGWFEVFGVLLPGLTALAMVPVLAGCESLNQREKLRSIPRRKTAAVLFWIGALTYPVYLVHPAVLAGVQAGLPGNTYPSKWAIGTVLVLFVAWMLHMTVEQAVLNWRRNLSGRETEMAVAEPLEHAMAT